MINFHYDQTECHRFYILQDIEVCVGFNFWVLYEHSIRLKGIECYIFTNHIRYLIIISNINAVLLHMSLNVMYFKYLDKQVYIINFIKIEN